MSLVRRIVVLSDLHIGAGQEKGRPNVFDDFREDDRFAQLLEHYGRPRGDRDEVHLVLNGDIFDLIKVSVDGRFPEAITEKVARQKLDACFRGHPKVVSALRGFLAREKNRLTFQPGNHDMELFFPGVQRLFTRALTGEDAHPRVAFPREEPHVEIDGVQFHHGHQFEAIHAMDFGRLFLSGRGAPILNLPWGTLFMLQVVNHLMRDRPYLDKVTPFWPLFAGGLFFDTRFTLKLMGLSSYYFIRAQLNPLWRDKRPLAKATQFLRTEFKITSDLNHFAKRILKAPKLAAVFMGHTHYELVRTHPGGKFYVNTGTWMPMVSLKVGNLGQSTALHYGLVEYDRDGRPEVALRRWHGRPPLSEEVVA
jgi:UDP-2,3-diacylglucosamine pyrophosphatase LpxH